MIRQLSEELKKIIELEKQAGNKIVQIDRQWPQSGKINVLLSKRFQADHSGIKGVEYVQDNDPRNKIEMYFDVHSGDCIYCSTF